MKETAHVAEMIEALGELSQVFDLPAIEIGGGVSPYAAWLRSLGYRYLGIEPSKWAANFMRSLRFPVLSHPWPVHVTEKVSLILSAHSLEHMTDAPQALLAMYEAMNPGGMLLLLVPDDSDPTNADHLWFFNESSLRALLERIGFVIERLAVRQIVSHEKFIYVRATRAI